MHDLSAFGFAIERALDALYLTFDAPDARQQLLLFTDCVCHFAVYSIAPLPIQRRISARAYLVSSRGYFLQMSASGPNAKCRPGPEMSAVWGRPDIPPTSRNRRV